MRLCRTSSVALASTWSSKICCLGLLTRARSLSPDEYPQANAESQSGEYDASILTARENHAFSISGLHIQTLATVESTIEFWLPASPAQKCRDARVADSVLGITDQDSGRPRK
ncbi:hypothetical protein BJ166DRAFT_383810 [Pestalotiopsis sp. NC0098]|nr:hypothetical protein BJ166DRAFT_383810 [Pestalotiopsis sp. NC0098]